jgi:hypothetical protein
MAGFIIWWTLPRRPPGDDKDGKGEKREVK